MMNHPNEPTGTNPENTQKITPKKVLVTFIKIIVSAGLLFWVLYGLDFNKIWGAISSISIGLFVKLIAINLVILFIKTIRWYWIINVQGKVISYPMVFSIFVRAFFLGLITPGRIGEFIKVKYLSDLVPSFSYSKSLTTVLVDRFLDLAVLLALSILGFFLFFSSLAPTIGVSGVHFLFIGFGIALGIFIIIFRKPLDRLFQRFSLYKKLHKKFLDAWSDFKEGIKSYSIRVLLFPAFLTLVDTLLIGFQLHFTIIEFQLDSVFHYFHSLVSICFANIVALIPITVSGFGAREAIYAVLLGSVGVSRELAVSISFLTFVAQYLLFFPILLLLYPLQWVIQKMGAAKQKAK